MAPRATPSMATKMSLRGAWTRTRPPPRAGAERPADRLAPRPDRGSDTVALLQFPAEIGLDELTDGPVRVDRVDPDLAHVLGGGAGAEDVQLMADGQAVVGADR